MKIERWAKTETINTLELDRDDLRMEPVMKIKRKTKTETIHTIELDRDDIIALLRAAGHSLPDNAEVLFDCSASQEVSIDKDDPVRVLWHTGESSEVVE